MWVFDFFANCEYFEEKYNYDQVIELPRPAAPASGGGGGGGVSKEFENLGLDPVKTFKEEQIGWEGMKIDRMFFERFEETVKKDEFIDKNIKDGNWDAVHDYIHNEIFDKPEEYFNLEKLRRAAKVDRRLSLREIIEKIYGFITHFKSKDELLEDEFEKFISIYKPGSEDLQAIRYFFKAYITDNNVRRIIESRHFAEFNVNKTFNMNDYKAVGKRWREIIPEYTKDYVPLNQFMN